MKKIVSLILVSVLLASMLSGCANHSKYKKYDSTGERYDCYLPDYIKICNYSNLEVPNLVYKLTPEKLQKKIDRERAIFSQDEPNPDRGAKYGDIADIVVETYMDGEIYDYLTFKLDNRDMGKSVVVGCEELDIPEVDEALMGMRQGDTKEITFNLPDPYFRSLKVSGKEVTMKITMNNLYGIDDPVEGDDEFFIHRYGYTLDQYKAYCTSTTEQEYNGFIEDYKSDIVWEYIYEHTTVKKYPEEYDKLYEETLNAYRNAAKDKGKNLIEYVNENLKYDSLEAFEEHLNEEVQNTCKREMILYYIARSENLTYTQEFYEAELLEYAETFEIKTVEEAESFVDYQVGLDYFKERVRLNYVYVWLGENAKLRTDVTTYINNLNK